LILPFLGLLESYSWGHSLKMILPHQLGDPEILIAEVVSPHKTPCTLLHLGSQETLLDIVVYGLTVNHGCIYSVKEFPNLHLVPYLLLMFVLKYNHQPFLSIAEPSLHQHESVSEILSCANSTILLGFLEVW